MQIGITVLLGCDFCGSPDLLNGKHICERCSERQRKQEIATLPIAIKTHDYAGSILYRLEDGRYGDGEAIFQEFYHIPNWEGVYELPEGANPCPKCGGQMERRTAPAPNNAGSDAEWDECLCCEHKTNP